MGRSEAQWEIKALWDGEGCRGDEHYELQVAILNHGPTVGLVVELTMMMAADSNVIFQIILVAAEVIRDGHV